MRMQSIATRGPNPLPDPLRSQGDRAFAEALSSFFDARDKVGSRSGATALISASGFLDDGSTLLSQAVGASDPRVVAVDDAARGASQLGRDLLGVASSGSTPDSVRTSIDAWIDTTIDAAAVFAPDRRLPSPFD